MFQGWSFFSQPDSADIGADKGHTANAQPSGLVGSTKVATSRGWIAAGDLKAGDLVLTFDAGLQTVTQVTRETPWSEAGHCPKALWPLEVPAGAFGNDRPFFLLGGQNIMVESDAAEDMFGDPFSIIPASALQGVRQIEKAPPKDAMEIVHIYFADEQVVFGEFGALYLCPSSLDVVELAFEGARDPLYSILPPAEAQIVASALRADMCSFSGEMPLYARDAVYA
ncbi:MAG: Hint domain-containing protein [Pseudomonadota bacterium]